MFETYEEKAGKALDTLYPGALFLAAGDEAEAERLLIETVARALHFDVYDAEASTRWFEARLAARFFEGTQLENPQRGWGSPVEGIAVAGGNDLLRGAAEVPAWARPALWLVLLRQWSYGEAREALGVSSDELKEMLAHRTTLAAALLNPHERRNRSEGLSR